MSEPLVLVKGPHMYPQSLTLKSHSTADLQLIPSYDLPDFLLQNWHCKQWTGRHVRKGVLATSLWISLPFASWVKQTNKQGKQKNFCLFVRLLLEWNIFLHLCWGWEIFIYVVSGLKEDYRVLCFHWRLLLWYFLIRIPRKPGKSPDTVKLHQFTPSTWWEQKHRKKR